MSSPSSSPRGEHTPRPGITWTTTVGWSGEQLVDDDAPDHRPNRATRRALARTRPAAPDPDPADDDSTPACICTYGERCPNCRD
ncbi:hypothetical protein [Streptomyces sp. SLBN-134]|uniref:hypothetical protein n=1 Tax=Streptomyces sp. SLBN-134 TaxID=2768456 RepID=UPI0011518547|nr:hypothetical protein [Streptomyces sp. SLBN-134]